MVHYFILYTIQYLPTCQNDTDRSQQQADQPQESATTDPQVSEESIEGNC